MEEDGEDEDEEDEEARCGATEAVRTAAPLLPPHTPPPLLPSQGRCCSQDLTAGDGASADPFPGLVHAAHPCTRVLVAPSTGALDSGTEVPDPSTDALDVGPSKPGGRYYCQLSDAVQSAAAEGFQKKGPPKILE